jgi:microcystin-dependent protein
MDYYLGQICVFPYQFEPVGFDRCDGREVSILRNEYLYSLIGKTFGGHPGYDNFCLPDLRGKALPAPSPYGRDPHDYFICMEGIAPWGSWRPFDFTMGQILLFPYPVNYDRWGDQDKLEGLLPCNGGYVGIWDYEKLYELIGDRFGPLDDEGGSFKLPDLRKAVPIKDLYYMICAKGIYPTRD